MTHFCVIRESEYAIPVATKKSAPATTSFLSFLVAGSILGLHQTKFFLTSLAGEEKFHRLIHRLTMGW